jgi:hypothetical protein
VSCRSTVPNRVPLQEPFPMVQGRSLAGEEVRLPVVGAPILLLVGYAQRRNSTRTAGSSGCFRPGSPCA